MLNNQSEHFKSGFVAVVGRPNVGKSTLINALIGDKIVIVSDKAQTTRNRIICVYTDQEKQIVFMDTPGIHKPKHKLGEFMVTAAVDSLKEVESVLFLVAANEKRGPHSPLVCGPPQHSSGLCIRRLHPGLHPLPARLRHGWPPTGPQYLPIL